MLKKLLPAAMILALALPAMAQTPQTPGLDKREANMEKRIEQGKDSGRLTAREAARLERRKDKLERAEERAKADGVVTPQERRRLNRQADHLSTGIAKEKHDQQTAPRP